MIKLEHVSKSFENLKIFDDFSLEFAEGDITAILGPSGCGKTTLLNIMAGLVKVDQGVVETGDQVSYLFQEPRLLPWLRIEENVALVLQDKMPEREIGERVAENLKATGLLEYADYFPGQLSGGMRQRAAMARAFSYDAPLLLMDEPFKSLDIKTRYQLTDVFLRLWERKPRSVIMVTHDVKEAVLLRGRIVVLSDKPAQIAGYFENDSGRTVKADSLTTLELEQQVMRLLLK